MKYHHRIPLLLCSLCTASLTVMAQNTTNLPTSMYGVGELSAGDGGRYAGMGNVGIALNRTGFLNTLNPAAITHKTYRRTSFQCQIHRIDSSDDTIFCLISDD